MIGVFTYIGRKGEQMRGYKQENPREGSFRRPPLAEIGADAARSFADHTTGVGGTGEMPRRCRWRSGNRRSSAGYTETGTVGKIHSDIITTLRINSSGLSKGTRKEQGGEGGAGRSAQGGRTTPPLGGTNLRYLPTIKSQFHDSLQFPFPDKPRKFP